MPVAKVNDVALYYETIGAGEPVILVAGLGAYHTMWTAILHYLRPKYQVVLVDNRGSGQSSTPSDHYTIEMMADDLSALCHKLSLPPAHCVGSSMGGAIVQNLAYRYPQQVKSLVLVNSAMQFDWIIGLYQESAIALSTECPSSQVARITMHLTWVYSSQFLKQPVVLDKLIKIQCNDPYPSSASALRSQLAALNTFCSSSYLPRIQVPCLVTGSDEDRLCRERTTRALAAKIPKAEYFFFEHCGHLPQIEYPKKFFTALDTFIAKHV